MPYSTDIPKTTLGLNEKLRNFERRILELENKVKDLQEYDTQGLNFSFNSADSGSAEQLITVKNGKIVVVTDA